MLPAMEGCASRNIMVGRSLADHSPLALSPLHCFASTQKPSRTTATPHYTKPGQVRSLRQPYLRIYGPFDMLISDELGDDVGRALGDLERPAVRRLDRLHQSQWSWQGFWRLGEIGAGREEGRVQNPACFGRMGISSAAGGWCASLHPHPHWVCINKTCHG
jgi:hypothetical protein